MRGTELEVLKAFVLIAEKRSYVKAAKLLGIAVSTHNHRIKQLESRQGARLLNRTTCNFAPTEVGSSAKICFPRPAIIPLMFACEVLSSALSYTGRQGTVA